MIFQLRVEVWLLSPAVQVLREIEKDHGPSSAWSHSAFAVLCMIFPYFEMIGKTMNPKSTPDTTFPDFKAGFEDIYGKGRFTRKQIAGFWDRFRNGLYHLGHTKRESGIHNSAKYPSVDFAVIDGRKLDATQVSVYLVNPHRVTRTIVAHFPDFIERLKRRDASGEAMRSRFNVFFDEYFEP